MSRNDKQTTGHVQDEVQALRRLKQAVAELPADIQPERDLWHGIESRLAKPKASHSRWWEMAVAAGVAAMVSSGVLWFGQRTGSETAMPVTALAAYQQVDAAYAPVRKVALERFQAQTQGMDPAVRETVVKNLAIIDQALSEIRLALKDRPNDPVLNQLLQRTYEQEIDVLNAVLPAQNVESI
ncbi:MAG: hypothetical protein HYV16_09590 [Gammaproteobacteria bacterium]|nr:hypothetical protein [Gammaproteobacteria bacterium]